MTTQTDNSGSTDIDTIWFTRCAGNGRGGVPTATGLAYQLGWLDNEFKPDGITLPILPELRWLIALDLGMDLIPKRSGVDPVNLGLFCIQPDLHFRLSQTRIRIHVFEPLVFF